MNFLTSYWIWVVVAAFFAGMYLFGRGRGERVDAGHAQVPEAFGHDDHEKHGTMNNDPQNAQEQEKQQGHKHHGGCC